MPLDHRRRASDSSGEVEPTRRHFWTFDRRISLDTMVGIVGIAIVIGGPMFLAWRAMESRLLMVEIKNDLQQKADERRDLETREFRNQIGSQLLELSKQMTQTQISLGILTAPAPTIRAAGKP
jgi:hypothetical protein